MLTIVNILFDICFLRRGPQHLPRSMVLAVAVTVLYVGGSLLLDFLTGETRSSLLRALVYTGLAFLLLLMILRWRTLSDRLIQTWTAYAGCGVLVSAAVTPLAWALGRAQDQQLDPNPLGTLVFLFLFFWSFVIDAHILRNSLNVSFSVGFLYATLIFAVLSTARFLLFTPAP